MENSSAATVLALRITVGLGGQVLLAFLTAGFTRAQLYDLNVIDRGMVAVVAASSFFGRYVLLALVAAVTFAPHHSLPVHLEEFSDCYLAEKGVSTGNYPQPTPCLLYMTTVNCTLH